MTSNAAPAAELSRRHRRCRAEPVESAGDRGAPGGDALLAAYHRDAVWLPAPFRSWASISSIEPDLAELKHHLQTGFIGLQLPASELVTPGFVGARRAGLAGLRGAGSARC